MSLSKGLRFLWFVPMLATIGWLLIDPVGALFDYENVLLLCFLISEFCVLIGILTISKPKD